ncbi:MAG: glutaredoxin family protein [Gammaproteobacteria bacterium]|nr:glutaredoxin family protein [Gammaproteobacteria bacterium]
MALALAPLATEWGFEVVHVNVDSEPALVARHGADVPVLVHGDTPLCRHFLDAPRVRAYLAEIR